MCGNENISLRIIMIGENIFGDMKMVSLQLTRFSVFAIKRA